MWRLNACLRLKPLAVALKRLAAPRPSFTMQVITTSFEHLFGSFAPLQNDLQVRSEYSKASLFKQKHLHPISEFKQDDFIISL